MDIATWEWVVCVFLRQYGLKANFYGQNFCTFPLYIFLGISMDIATWEWVVCVFLRQYGLKTNFHRSKYV